MKSKKILVIVFLVIIFALAFIRSVFAYYTAYTVAQGEVTIYTTTIPEELSINCEATENKNVVKVFNGGLTECYVRVKNIYGITTQMSISDESSEKWSYVDGYYYYEDILSPDEYAEELIFFISELPDYEQVNIITVVEATGISYDSDGNKYADWNQTIEVAD